jgi:heme oxygenase
MKTNGAGAARQGQRPDGLAGALRERTRALHARAERSGIVRELLRGRASRDAYALLLRNLLPAYTALEHGLDRHRDSPGVRQVALPALYRAGALASDLAALSGRKWDRSLALLPAGERYEHAVTQAAEGNGARLIAHAYARYLGDLSGGQVMKRLLAQSLALAPQSLAFYDFPEIADASAFKTEYRDALDRAAGELSDVNAVLDEAGAAFGLNIDVSEAVLAAATGR